MNQMVALSQVKGNSEIIIQCVFDRTEGKIMVQVIVHLETLTTGVTGQ